VALVDTLHVRGIHPLDIGRVLLASREPRQPEILEVIRELGLEYQVIFNKGSVMVLPSGVNKATGLAVALAELGLQASAVAGIGDGENDHAFLEACGFYAAVSNAIPSLQADADWVATERDGAGVRQLVELILGDAPLPVGKSRAHRRV
jgi:hydroxymethylpyrimidine pyrophosphatase-like HAD family hydrolase